MYQNLKNKNNIIQVLIVGYLLRIFFSFFGHNVDWLGIKQHISFTMDGVDTYSYMKTYPYFPSRFYLEIISTNISEYLDLSSFLFINFERLLMISIYFLVQSSVLIYCKEELPKRLFNYFNISFVLAFVSGFGNQLDAFVLITTISLLFKVDKAFEKKTLFISGFLFFIFLSMKPITALIYIPLLFIYKSKKNFIYFLIGNMVSLIINWLIWFNTSLLGIQFDVNSVLPSILKYKGFNNFPLLDLLNMNFSLKLSYLKFGNHLNARNLLIILFIFFLTKKLYKLKNLDLNHIIFYYLIYTFIFAPQIAQQNLPILFIAINFYRIEKIKSHLTFIEVVTTIYLLLLNMFFVVEGYISNQDYLLVKLFNVLNYYGLAFIPNEFYFGNFIVLALVYLTYFESNKTQYSDNI